MSDISERQGDDNESNTPQYTSIHPNLYKASAANSKLLPKRKSLHNKVMKPYTYI